MQTNGLKQVAARAVVAFLAFVGASTLAVQSSFAEAVPPTLSTDHSFAARISANTLRFTTEIA